MTHEEKGEVRWGEKEKKKKRIKRVNDKKENGKEEG
jgi:hypothetical protein